MKLPELDKNKKIAIGAVGVLGLGALGYFLLSSKKEKSDKLPQINIPPVVAGKTTAGWIEGNFPLKQGDFNNNKVYRLQKALGMNATDADGDFGPKTASTLQANGYPAVITESVYNTILGGGGGSSSSSAVTLQSAKTIANSIYNKAYAKDLAGVITELRKLNTTADYTAVNTEYKNIGIVSTTLVTHLLANSMTFVSEGDKEKIRSEFLRMGLKYNGSSWSLSGGLGMLPVPFGRLVKTIAPTAVRDQNGTLYNVDTNNILGTELGRSEDGMALILAANNSLLYATANLLTITE